MSYFLIVLSGIVGFFVGRNVEWKSVQPMLQKISTLNAVLLLQLHEATGKELSANDRRFLELGLKGKFAEALEFEKMAKAGGSNGN